MLKKFGEEKLNFQLRQHFAAAVASFMESWHRQKGESADLLLDHFFDGLVKGRIDDSESFRVRFFPHRWSAKKSRGAALLLSLYEPDLRFQKAILFRGRVTLNFASTEEGNLFDTDRIKKEAAEMLKTSQSSCFASFAPQGIHVLSASSVLGDAAADAYLLKNFYYLNIADFVGNLFFKCFVGDTRPSFIAGLQEGKYCRNLLEIRITAIPPPSQKPLF
jgi:hypothetical protein